MRFTRKQCKDFKKWGYPQEGDGRIVVGASVGMAQVVDTAVIPTLEGVMEWLGKEYGEDIYIGQLRRDKCWLACTHEYFNETCDGPFMHGSTAHEALYNLAEKVKGEK